MIKAEYICNNKTLQLEKYNKLNSFLSEKQI